MFAKMINEINKHNKIIIIRHKNPDYDAYGSQIGLYYSLLNKYRNKEIYVCGDENQANIFNKKMDVLNENDYENALVIVVDTACLNMLPDASCLKADKIIVLDHHNNKTDLTDLYVSKTDYSSASELIAEFSYKFLSVDKNAAQALLIGIIGDSNRFLYKGTTNHTFEITSKLITSGADLLKSYELMKKEDPIEERRYKGYVLSKFVIKENVAYVYNSLKTIKKHGVSPLFASRGCINLMADIKGVDAFLSFTEDEGEKLYVEFRSKNKSVVEVAREIGGGGHDLACGATINKNVDIIEIVDKVIEVLK